MVNWTPLIWMVGVPALGMGGAAGVMTFLLTRPKAAKR